MKPIIQLLGDTYKAAQFIRFAERKLNDLKVQMGLLGIDMQNRLYRFTTDSIEVYIESYKGFDKVRIRAGKVAVGCEVNFAFIPNISSSLFIEFTGIMKKGTDEIFWDFGDGSYLHTTEEAGDTDPLHEYENAGEYTVTATGIEFDEDAESQPDVPFSNVLREGTVDNPSVISHAHGYSLFQAAGFIPTGSDSLGAGYESFYEPLGLSWLTRAVRKTTTIPFQDIADYPSVVSKKSLIWLEGLRRTYIQDVAGSDPVYEVVSGSDLGLSMRLSSLLRPASEITPIDNNIDMVETIVKLDDNGGYPILPDPSLLLPMPPGGRSYRGWITRTDGNNLIKVRPYKCMAIKTKTITVA